MQILTLMAMAVKSIRIQIDHRSPSIVYRPSSLVPIYRLALPSDILHKTKPSSPKDPTYATFL